MLLLGWRTASANQHTRANQHQHQHQTKNHHPPKVLFFYGLLVFGFLSLYLILLNTAK